MDFLNYQRRFKIACSRLKYKHEQIDNLLAYAKKINNNNLPIIYNDEHLSLLLGFKKELLYKISNASYKFYRHFTIPKRNGKNREIFEPYPTLKEIQYWILENILSKVQVSKYAKAYIKRMSVLDNARFHRNQKVVLKYDIKNFFGSIATSSISRIFFKLGYSKQVSALLANICCLNNSLPQGAPTSPCLSNIFFLEIDKALGTYTNKRQFRYTRYSDDITISGNINHEQIGKIHSFLILVMKRVNLQLQKDKQKILRRTSQQNITGIVVNVKMSIKNSLKDKIRQDVYYINKFGLDSHIARCGIKQRNYLNHLKGLINWILFVEKKNSEFLQYKLLLLSIK